MKTNEKSIGISFILTMILVFVLVTVLSSCSISKGLTNEQITHRNNIDNELEWLYLEYSYQRDSLIIEFYKK